MEKMKNRLLEMTRTMKMYDEAANLIGWDLRTKAPRKGAERRAEVLAQLSVDSFKILTSPQMKECLDSLSDPNVYTSLDEVTAKTVQECKKEYERNQNIPSELYREYSTLTAHAETIWEEAKESNDYQLFSPYLEKIVAINQQFIDFWKPKHTRYDALLEMYEPGMTVEQIDKLFHTLRNQTTDLIQSVSSSVSSPSFLNQTFDIQAQKEFGLAVLKDMGYDFEAGRLDESMHPFAIGLNPGDVRITTRYLEHDVTSALFGTIHEGGHALYEQNIHSRLIGSVLCDGASMAIHESQSRFWENLIGRSLPFWRRYYPSLQKKFPQIDVSVEEFHRSINRVEPSLIRIEADELTYNIHIIIRYEIEKMLFNEELKVKDLPEVWREKYRQYLGVAPANDAEGVLQDVHWAGGSFGYFPSYTLGNMYAAQWMNQIEKEIPKVWDHVEKGEFYVIKEWLTKNIHQYGKLKTPAELVQNVTHETLNANYLSEYLKKKFGSTVQSK